MCEIYIKQNGEMKEVIPFIWHDVGHSHVETIGIMTKEVWEDVILEEKGIWEDIAELGIIYYNKKEVLREEY